MLGTTKRIKTQLTYRVPKWNFCNLQGFGGIGYSEERCRFCTTTVVTDTVDVPVASSNRGRMGASSTRQKTVKREVTVCSLHNWPLTIQEGILVQKCQQCKRSTAGFKEDVDCDKGDGETLHESKYLRDVIGSMPVSDDIDVLGLMRYFAAELQANFKKGLSYPMSVTSAELATLQWMEENK